MIRKQIIATNELDRQNQIIPIPVLNDMAVLISTSEFATKMSVMHDATLLPVGKVISGELIDLENGIVALETKIDDFMDDFKLILGPDDEPMYLGQSTIDFRPFTEHGESFEGELVVSLNPIDFSKQSYDEIIRYVTDSEMGEVESHAKKAAEPEIEILFSLATNFLLYLTAKKAFDKTAEKISEDIASGYDKVKRIVGFIFSRIAGKRTTTFVITGPNQVIELIIRCDSAETFNKAMEEKDSGYIADTFERYCQIFSDGINKMQFLFNEDTNKWELNYLTSNSGQVIGSEKCYKNTKRIYDQTLASPTAAFSLGATVTYQVEEISDA